MKVIIAGSRGIEDHEILLEAIEESGFDITEVVSGGARGVDLMGEDYANAVDTPIKQFIPNWGKPPHTIRNAGNIRNGQMAEYADALIAIWDGKSTGTKDMIKKAIINKLKVHVHRI